MGGKEPGVKETPQQRAMVTLAMNQLADYKQRWLPLQRQLAKQIESAGAEGSTEREMAQGAASTETEAKFSGARRALEAGLGARGELGSSKGKLAIAGLGEDQATSTGLGLALTEQEMDDAYVQGLSQITAIGRGEKATAMDGMSRVAGLSGQRAAADAEAALSNRMGNARLGAQVVGMGLGAWNPSPGGAPAVGMGSNPNGFQGTMNNPSAFVPTGP